jgi:4-hydroxymandelate oxidase
MLAGTDGEVRRNVQSSAGRATIENIRAWARITLIPRAFSDVTSVDPGIDLWGQRFAAPLILAPWAAQSAVHADGEIATATAAQRAGIGFALSSSTTMPVARVGEASGPFFQQLYLSADRSAVLPFVERSRAAGATAFMLTVDAPASAIGTPFRQPGRTVSEDWPDGAPAGHASDLSLHDIGWLRETTGLPVFCKGVLRADDAVAAVDAGADGIVVSNHGGRQIGSVVPTAYALPAIAAAVGDRVPVIVDSGIRSPDDVLKAIALGARAVMLGRPIAWALALGGADAVAGYLEAFIHELTHTMARVGAARIGDVDRSFVWSDGPNP